MGQVIWIGTLPDDVLLEIFNCCVDESPSLQVAERTSQSLVHACPRWRSIIFGSPRHLDQQLVCTSNTPAGDMLDVVLCIRAGRDVSDALVGTYELVNQ